MTKRALTCYPVLTGAACLTKRVDHNGWMQTLLQVEHYCYNAFLFSSLTDLHVQSTITKTLFHSNQTVNNVCNLKLVCIISKSIILNLLVKYSHLKSSRRKLLSGLTTCFWTDLLKKDLKFWSRNCTADV